MHLDEPDFAMDAARCSGRLAPVDVMQPAQDGRGHETVGEFARGRVSVAFVRGLRRPPTESLVRTGLVVVANVLGNEPRQVLLVQRNHVIKQLPPQRSEEPLDKRILPGTSRCRGHLCKPGTLPVAAHDPDRPAPQRRAAAEVTSPEILCPDNRITGGRTHAAHTRKVQNRLATALRMAAQSLHRSKSELGDWFRRIKSKLGTKAAVTAAAHKLARILWAMIKYRRPYDASRLGNPELARAKKEAYLRRQAKQLGFALTPAERAVS